MEKGSLSKYATTKTICGRNKDFQEIFTKTFPCQMKFHCFYLLHKRIDKLSAPTARNQIGLKIGFHMCVEYDSVFCVYKILKEINKIATKVFKL